MLRDLRRHLIALALPEGVVLALAAGVRGWEPVRASVAPFLPAYPVAMLVIGLLLAWRFQRPRITAMLLLLALADRALHHVGVDPVAAAGIALLLPVNVALVPLLPFRRAPRSAGLALAGAVAVQTVAIVVLRDPAFADLAARLRAPILPDALAGWTPVAPPALLAFAGALLLLAARILLRPDPQSRGFLWALVAAFLAVHAATVTAPVAFPPAQPLTAATYWFATAGLVLVVATIETSHALAFRDGLTGLPGRRAFDEAIRRLPGPWTVAMVDVDHFKRVNDTHGHDVGDQVLRMVAAELERVGGGGRAYRYGGEEFALLFPGRSAAQAVSHLEALRAAIAETPFVLRAPDRPRARPEKPKRASTSGREIAVTVSIGYAEAGPGTGGARAADVVQAADAALYRAKQEGRNRVEGHEVDAGRRRRGRKRTG